MKPLLIWDFDGTIVDNASLLLACMNTALAELGSTHVLTRQDLCVCSLEQLIKKSSLSVFRIPSFIRRVTALVEQETLSIRPHPHIQELLSFCAQHATQVIVSSNKQEIILRYLALHSLESFFSSVSSAGFFTKSLAIRRQRRDFGLSKHSCLYIGDESRDIHAAHQAGIDILSVSWGLQGAAALLDARPRFLASTVSEAKELLSVWFTYAQSMR